MRKSKITYLQDSLPEVDCSNNVIVAKININDFRKFIAQSNEPIKEVFEIAIRADVADVSDEYGGTVAG